MLLGSPVRNCGPRNSAICVTRGESHAAPTPPPVSPTEVASLSIPAYKPPRDWLRGDLGTARSGAGDGFALERNTATNEFRDPPLPGDKRGGAA